MNLGLWDIENLLSQAYQELTNMQQTLLQKRIHSPGRLETRKSRKQPEIYYCFYTHGKRHTKKVPADEISTYEQEIRRLQNIEADLRITRKKLTLVKKCLKTLHLDPQQLSATESPSPVIPSSAVYPENLKHLTLRGEYVRSKSEALLANIFYYHNIPYQYEKPLILNGRMVLPDFTLIGPDGHEIYWEHLGMLHIKSYAQKWAEKNRFYTMHQISEGNGLVITQDRNGVFDELDALFKIKALHLSRLPN